jgi:hypothetical protein
MRLKPSHCLTHHLLVQPLARIKIEMAAVIFIQLLRRAGLRESLSDLRNGDQRIGVPSLSS